MDIKLKNKTNLGIAAGIIVCFLAAGVMLGLCPVYKNMAENYSSDFNIDGYVHTMLKASYVLNMKAIDAVSGVNEDPARVYLPDFDGKIEDPEQADELLSRFYSVYREWENNLTNLKQFYFYEVLNENGESLLGSSDASLYQKIKQGELKEPYLILDFDENGKLKVEDFSGFENVFERVRNASERNPLEFYFNLPEDYYEIDHLTFAAPKNRKFVYCLDEASVEAYEQEINSRYGYMNTGGIQLTFLGAAVFVVLFALLLPFVPRLDLDSMKFFRAPLEVSAGIFFFSFLFMWGAMELTGSVCNGELMRGIMEVGFAVSVKDAEFIAYGLTFAVWTVVFFIIYWTATCIRPIFTMGVGRYLKERTWFFGLCAVMVGFLKKLGRSFEKIDFRERSNKVVFKIVIANFIVLVLICSFWFFGIFALIIYSFILFGVLMKYYNDMQEKYLILLSAANQIAEGNLEVRIQENLGVFEPFKEEIEKIQTGLKKAVEEEVKSQSMKTELVTNVSHDLKTPLTAIITYVNLLKQENITPEQQADYIDILEKKSMRLKFLIEDLFEISKANSNDVTLNLSDVDLVSLLKEVKVDLADKLDHSSVKFKWMLPKEKIILNLDGQKMYRVFENLLVNIVKYSLEESRAYISIEQMEDFVVITMKNISAVELDLQGEDFTERFVRGDKSRNTEGSGLGLAIAKSFVEVQGGKMQVETDGDLFKVIIRFKAAVENTNE